MRGSRPCRRTSAGFPAALATVLVATTLSVLGSLGSASAGAPASLQIYPLANPDGEPYDIAVGPDGNLWVPYNFSGRVDRITPTGEVTAFTFENTNFIFPRITAGSDGNLWILDLGSNSIDRLTPDGASLTKFQFSGGGGVGDIALGPDGNVWFTEANSSHVGRITPEGVITEFNLPEGSAPTGITGGPDGNIWVAEQFTNQIARITPTGDITHFDLPLTVPTDNVFAQGVHRITLGPDGNLWYTKIEPGVIGRITPAGVITEFVLPGGTQPVEITTGPDGNLWFTTWFDNRIGRITPDGQVGFFSVAEGGPTNITAGPDGRLWFTMPGPARVGAFEPFVPEPSPPDIRIIAPPNSTVEGGNTVLITGYDVGAATQVRFGTTPATSFTVVGPSQILAVVPPHAPGQTNVTVVTPSGRTRASLASKFFYSSPGCGLVVTTDTILQNDVGPCYDNGISIEADNITLDLNGKRVFGFPAPSDGNSAGITLANRSGARVRNGTVSGFDAGVVLDGGGGHTLTNLNIRHNIGPDNAFTANLGDGIVLFNSSDNQIRNNVVVHNGIFDGIGVLGTMANRNTIANNRVEDTVGPSDGGPAGQGIVVSAPGLNEQTGIPIVGNNVLDNFVLRNASAGISNVNNTQASIRRNVVANNGHTNFGGNGIGVQPGLGSIQPESQLFIEANRVRNNGQHGIVVSSQANRIINNISVDNDVMGWGFFDLVDENPDCDENVWRRNVWGSAGYSPPCVTAGGSGPPPPPVAAAPAPAANAEQTAQIVRRRPSP